MKKTYQMQGYVLHLIPTKKFKTVTMSLKLRNELTREETTLRTLLTFVLIAATKQYPSTQQLASYLDECYGAGLSTNIGTKGKSQIINIYTQFVNENYTVEKEPLLKKQIQLLSDLFYAPFCHEGAFDPMIVELKKKELKERLQANKDDKFSYALEQTLKYMGKDQILGISSNGYEEDIDDITPKMLYKYFEKCISEDEKHLYVVGDIDESIVKLFEECLHFPSHNNNFASSYIYKTNRKNILEFVEMQDITQSKLNIGYRIDCDFMHKNHYAFTVFNALFGGFSQSRLFKVVREQHSLCYYVSSSYDAFNGIMLVNAGIEKKDYEKTRRLIGEQLQDIQSGNLNDEDIEVAKVMLKNSLKKTNDEALSMISLAYNRDITHKKETNDEYIDKLLNVTKEEIVEVANHVLLDTIYLLTGKDNDNKNEND